MPRASTPRWLDEREAHLWRSWIRTVHALEAAIAEQLHRDSGLSAADYAVLVELTEADDGACRARDLGLALFWARDRVSHQVRRMEQRGLVVREECAEDARGTIVRLTSAGRTAIERAAPNHVAATRACFFDVLSDSEIDLLTDIVDRIHANLVEG